MSSFSSYRGRIAPSPTGYLHLGHARTFWVAQQRALLHNGVLVLRNEDLDAARCKAVFADAMIADLLWLGLRWQEGPDRGGPFQPYAQSQRFDYYRATLSRLRDAGVIYPCSCSRQDVLRALGAPHLGEEEPIYPGTCRDRPVESERAGALSHKVSWRFRVPEGEQVSFEDGYFGRQQFVSGKDFGDFVVWRHDDVPSYQLAVVADDAAMQISEVVRGADLLLSTARQILIYRALNLPVPRFFHCPLLTDETGVRLAKRHDALSLQKLREQGVSPETLRDRWAHELTDPRLARCLPA